jgi:hypothetical protein
MHLGYRFFLILENETSASVTPNLMVFCADDGDGGQTVAGVHLDFDDHPLQADHSAEIDTGLHHSSYADITGNAMVETWNRLDRGCGNGICS